MFSLTNLARKGFKVESVMRNFDFFLNYHYYYCKFEQTIEQTGELSVISKPCDIKVMR